MDADCLVTEESFRLIQLVRRDSNSIPIIFISKHTGQPIEWKEQLQWLTPYRWLSKPCHIADLWQAVESLLPTISSSSQQG
jgi:two-component SAPR family response regulator